MEQVASDKWLISHLVQINMARYYMVSDKVYWSLLISSTVQVNAVVGTGVLGHVPSFGRAGHICKQRNAILA